MPLLDHNTDPPNSELIEELEVLGYKVDSVKRWTTSKALTVRDERRKSDAIARRREAAKDAPLRGFPLPMMRLHTAQYLAEQKTADDLTQALAAAMYQLCDSEVRRLAGYIGRLLEADGGFSPDQLFYKEKPSEHLPLMQPADHVGKDGEGELDAP